MNRTYIPALDGLRFLAFLLVFVHHAVGRNGTSTIGRAIATVADFGWIGVDLFLCLSAFLLTRLLLIEHERNGRINVPSFFVRRALRIWPLYVCMLIAGFGLIPLATKVAGVAWYPDDSLWRQHLLPFLLFVGNWSTAFYGYAKSPALNLLWTVSLEEQFYLVLPLIIATVPRRRPLACIAAGALAFSVLLRFWLVGNGVKPLVLYTITPTRLDAFAVGIALALIAPQARVWASRRRNALGITALLAVLVAMLLSSGNVDVAGEHLSYLYVLVAAIAGCLLLCGIA